MHTLLLFCIVLVCIINGQDSYHEERHFNALEDLFTNTLTQLHQKFHSHITEHSGKVVFLILQQKSLSLSSTLSLFLHKDCLIYHFVQLSKIEMSSLVVSGERAKLIIWISSSKMINPQSESLLLPTLL